MIRVFLLSLFTLASSSTARLLIPRAAAANCANIYGQQLVVDGTPYGPLVSNGAYCVCDTPDDLNAFIMNDQAASKAKNEKKLPNTRLAVSNLVEANLNQACISPPSARKRSPAEIARSRHQCEFGLSKCGIYSGIPSSYSSSSRESEPEFSAVGAYECIDTMFNLESCGGCVVPYTLGLTSDEVAELEPGVDCTAMPHVSDVECRMGRCIVHKCHAGSRRVPVLLANGDAGFECVPEGTILKGQSGVFNFLG